MNRDRSRSEIVEKLFGVNLEQQGRGFYIGLEMLAVARGVLEVDRDLVLDSGEGNLRYVRTSHDFARRIAANAEIDPSALKRAIDGDETLATVKALTSSLVIDIPGRRKTSSWYNSHFYPFVGQLVHYDATERHQKGSPRGSKQPKIERYVYRDGGSWAYRALRTDQNRDRRETNRNGLVELLRDSDSPLAEIARALQSHDYAVKEQYEDRSEPNIAVCEEKSPWPGHLRQGVSSIVSRTSVPRAKRIESLMHWVPYCLGRHQLHLARRSLGKPTETVYTDFLNGPTPLRRMSQNALDEHRMDIVNALIEKATELHNNAQRISDSASAERYAKHMSREAKGTVSARAFYSETLAAVGALNATTGRRHFTLKPAMLEALVAAALQPGEEMEYHAFCARTYETFSLLIDERTAGRNDLTFDIDSSVFSRNSAAFHSQLSATGLLTQYSDATSIVHGEPR